MLEKSVDGFYQEFSNDPEFGLRTELVNKTVTALQVGYLMSSKHRFGGAD